MPSGNAASTQLNTTAAGSGTLSASAWKEGQEIASGGLNVAIIDKPELILGKNNLLPAETTTISLAWGSGAVPAYTSVWSATDPGTVDGSGNSSRRFLASASKTGKSIVTVTITMTDTGYTFTLPPKEVTIAQSQLRIQGPNVIVAGDPNASWNLSLSPFDTAIGGKFRWSWTGSGGALCRTTRCPSIWSRLRPAAAR